MLQNVLNSTAYFQGNRIPKTNLPKTRIHSNCADVISFSSAKITVNSDKKLDKIMNKTDEAGKIAIFLHEDPDCDAGTSALALIHLINRRTAKKQKEKKQIDVYISGEIPKSLKEIEGVENFIQLKDIENKKFLDEKYNLAIALDTERADWLGEKGFALFNKMVESKVPTIKIDHHKEKGNDFADINLVDEKATSTTQMLIKLADKMDVTIDEKIAGLLYAGIATDSSFFSRLKDAPNTFKACARLTETGIDTEKIHLNLKKMTLPMFDYFRKALNNVRPYEGGKVIALNESREFIKKLPPEIQKDVQGRTKAMMEIGTTILPNIEGAKVIIRSRPSATGTTVVLRSNNGIPIDDIAREFGGGGHHAWAGCDVNDMSVPNATKTVLNRIKDRGLLD